MTDIKVGDLVVVVDGHCTRASVGMIRTVLSIKRDNPGRCATCGASIVLPIVAELDGPAPWSRWHLPPSWLRKIEPLAKLETSETKEELTA